MSASEEEVPGDPTIVIDGTSITLENRSSHGGYTLVVYRSGADLACAYLSQSEGLWRLCVLIDPTTFLNPHGRMDVMQKGHNYITTTQLHFKLQCFITEHLDHLRYVDETAIRDVIYAKPGTPRGDRILKMIGYTAPSLLFQTPELPIASLKPKREREYLHEVFEPLAIASDETGFRDTFSKIYSPYSLLRRTGFVYQSKYLKKLQELFGIGVKGSVINTNVFKNASVISKEDRYKTMVAVLSAYMKHFFTLSPGPAEYICTLPVNIQYAYSGFMGREMHDSSTLAVRVYKTTISLKEDSTAFHVYYGMYTMPETTLDSGTYKIILNILPATSRIGAFGLNDAYISANVYVYKMFEYSGITSPAHKQVNREGPRTTYNGKYNFIGDLLSNMWPLTETVEPATAVTAVAAVAAVDAEGAAAPQGGKRTRRTRRVKRSRKSKRRN